MISTWWIAHEKQNAWQVASFFPSIQMVIYINQEQPIGVDLGHALSRGRKFGRVGRIANAAQERRGK
jgi:hypothetical protein